LYTTLVRLDYRLTLWAATSASRTVSVVAELLFLIANGIQVLTSEGLDLETSFWHTGTSSEYLDHFICQGHRVKVKVTGAEKRRFIVHTE